MTTITTTLGQLVRCDEALARLATLKAPARSAYHLTKLIAVVRQELRHFEEVRVKTIKEFGVEREGQKDVWDVKAENMPAYQTQMVEVGATPVTIEWGPFDLACLGTQEISAADIDVLGPLVCWTE